jgi:hypothetical protein
MNSTPFQIITFVFGVAGVLGGASVYFFSSQTKADISRAQITIDLLKEENEALKARLTTLQSDYTVCKGQLLAVQGQLTAVQNMVTQAPQIKALAAKTAEQHKQLLAKLDLLIKATNNA